MTWRPDSTDAYEACVVRVGRADVHLKALRRLLDQFRKSNAYELVHQLDTQTTPPEIIIIGRVLKRPPVMQASVLIADAINNLRAALDNLVWALSVKFSGPAPAYPIPFGSPWRKIAFPVVLNKKDWTHVSQRNLGLIDPALATRFYRLQPCYRRKKQPRRDPLAVLDELWNIDKHRHLHLTHAFVGLKDVLSTYPLKIVAEAPPGYADALKHSYSIVSQHAPGPVEDETELGRVIEPNLTLAPEVYMHAYLAFDIAFEQGSPATGGLVIATLEDLRQEVMGILESFRGAL
jgi:hypothetical protein